MPKSGFRSYAWRWRAAPRRWWRCPIPRGEIWGADSGSPLTIAFCRVGVMTSQTQIRPLLTSASPCPCGSGQLFGQCCEPVLLQQRPAADAEYLMRSRFTAHVVGDDQHLHRTYLETASKPFVAEAADMAVVHWTRLVIHAHEVGSRPEMAWVDFSAFYQDGGNELALHEKAEFRHISGQWFYARSVRIGPAPVKAAPKVGRNEPCSCGSGKKFKHCCG